ncbi:hypothetical protein DSAG12_01125 [Promethearchaeum syntrophicum]|uniref:Uncharacterized protein n=1 Tax=Promethearchaeum syntrophicum TaxID=2594042 RepID=A0A5B9D973_9ARCH|nr:hypothetical protein [Candidatus Prometheoarchaeum syntrophicum]QEE15300.1 hypothetical protein DSAG12_01125 [Candidatus Prometheoarchaeum syntrophicum]
MVNITSSETIRIAQIILTIGIMSILLGTILFLDYFKKHEKKGVLITLVTLLITMLTTLLVIGIIEVTTVAIYDLEIWLFVNSIGILGITIIAVLLSEKLKKPSIRSIFVTFLAILYILMITISIFIWIGGTVEYDSLHLGSTLGLPALILVTIGTLLVIYDEPKYSIYHGYSAGGAWIITLLNVILLFTLTQDIMKGYSGWIHALHIICGGVGLTFGFASALFGTSGMRRLAKLTGYTTLGCWWLAYLLGFFIEFANISTL